MKQITTGFFTLQISDNKKYIYLKDMDDNYSFLQPTDVRELIEALQEIEKEQHRLLMEEINK